MHFNQDLQPIWSWLELNFEKIGKGHERATIFSSWTNDLLSLRLEREKIKQKDMTNGGC
jgi:hypothetical protein